MRINWFCSLARDGQPVELCQGGAIGSFVTAGVVGPFGLFGPPSLLAGWLARSRFPHPSAASELELGCPLQPLST